MPFRIVRWKGTGARARSDMEAEYRKRSMDFYTFSNHGGDHYPLHTHSYNKLLIMAAGEMRWRIEGRETFVRQGDAVFLDKNTEHEVDCLTATECLEGHY